MSSAITRNTRRRSDSRSAKRAISSAACHSVGGFTRPLSRPSRRAPDGGEVGVLERRRPHAHGEHVLARGDELAHDPRRVLAHGVGEQPRRPRAVSTSTPPAWLSSAGVPAATTAPPSMIATRSQTSSTSESRCELRSTPTPRSRSRSSSARTVRRPAGSSALVGSSSSSSRGSPMSAWAIPSRCCMPFDIAPTAPRPGRGRARRARAAPPAPPAPPGEPTSSWWSSSSSAGRAPVGEAEELGEVAQRAVRRRASRRARRTRGRRPRSGAPARR